MVPETRGDHSIFKRSFDKATSRRRHVKTKLQHHAGWALAYGAAVQQRTVRQETTMAKHGTLHEYIYQRHCIKSDQPINITLEEADQDEKHAQESEGPEEDSQTGEQAIRESGSELEYDESSNETDVGASDKVETPFTEKSGAP